MISVQEPSGIFLYAIFGAGCLFLFSGTIYGWSHGLWRCLGSAASLAAGIAAGLYFGPVLAEAVASQAGWESGGMMRPGIMLLTGALIFFICEVISRVLFPKTSNISRALFSFLTGFTGGLAGLALALAILALIVTGFRYGSSIAEAHLRVAHPEVTEDTQLSLVDRFAAGILSLNLATEPFQELIPWIQDAPSFSEGEEGQGEDYLPDPTMKVLSVGYQLASDFDKLEAFFARPDVQEMIESDALQNFLKNPRVQRAIEQQRFEALLFMSPTRELLRDPEVRRFVRDFELDE